MKKTTRKSLSLLVALAMVFTLFSGVAVAAEEGDFELDKETYRVVYSGTDEEVEMTVTVDEDDVADKVYAGVYEEGAGSWEDTTGSVEVDDGEVTFDIDFNTAALGEDTHNFKFYLSDDDLGGVDEEDAEYGYQDFRLRVFGEGVQDYSSGQSKVDDYDDEVDIEEASEFEVDFRYLDNTRFGDPDAVDGDNSADDVTFYVEVSHDAAEVEGASGSDGNVYKFEDKYLDDSNIYEFDVVSYKSGEIEVTLWKDYDSDDLSGEIDSVTIDVESPEGVDNIDLALDPDDEMKAGNELELTATATMNQYDAVGEDIVFEYREEDSDDDWDEIATVETDEDGEAEYDYEITTTGDYEFRAVWDDDDSMRSSEETLTVTAGDADAITAHEEAQFHNVEDDKFHVYFAIEDEFGNKLTKEDEMGVRVTDPEGDTYDADDDEITVTEDEEVNGTEEMYKVTVDYSEIDEEGDYEVRANIAGTTQRAYTTVTAAEFGDLEDIEIDLSHEATQDHDDLDEEFKVDVTLIDDQGMEKPYDHDDEDIRFSSSRSSIASVGRYDGEMNINSQGETTITITHNEEDLRDSAVFTVGEDPDYLEAEFEADRGELEGEVTLTIRDEDGYRTVNLDDDGEHIDEDFDVYLPDELEVVEDSKEDIEDGQGIFEIEAEDYGTYEVEVVTEEGLTTAFEVEFREEAERSVGMTIGEGTFTIDGEEYEFEDGVSPFIEDDRTMLPFRALAEALDADVSYDHDERKITTELEDITAEFWLGRTGFTVNDEAMTLEDDDGNAVVPYLDEDTGRTYMPVRAFSEALGADVTWDSATNEITIDR
ncbi:copper amine oxidase N-terminal domain-containing protein [Natranaerofaba carboxydovora]|uniref:copper amine oxidase N-terminal domain-containing protein n=1 Tax=Natranaerofaba carboxydovora TaxID=2742683 RepID=UPI001F131D70|nr:copper amine oxidase N-terminal domain-containing protein [Natranaerofaba carboxydovora]UMZ74749.1 hypothetical protein ACONDI_02351 [Natranaerofaba carboxydovora]